MERNVDQRFDSSEADFAAEENSMVVDKVLNTIVPGRAQREQQKSKEQKLDLELKETFPTSDPLASTQPGAGVTGSEVKPSKLSPSQIASGRK
ncbi:hypothetical protein LB518_22210 [Mesorhizobium sp. BR1-1-16]|uniref:hypothetical protein n=1 Tax=Mesorhizobium sp. BR1-1-16 TaxID=2876653 RepID=UPI001CCFAFAC|nr:hypothetical protein [Mesorhizobium sp. BR1-1-16]MBZ9939028.1 hypothetical protein [Mesorhizobium sp. BR1-1-16]